MMSRIKENPAIETHQTPPNPQTPSSPYLFAALCLFFAIPFLYQCVRTHLIADIPAVDGLRRAYRMVRPH